MKMPLRANYSHAQLFDFARQDLITDAECAEEQAMNGPYYAGITKETLSAYASECRTKVSLMDKRAQEAYVRKCIKHTLSWASPCPLPI